MDLPKYAIGATGVDKSAMASETKLSSLRTRVDNVDFDKLKTTSADLSKLSNVLDNDVVKRTVYYKLLTKVNAIDSNTKH